MMSLPVGFGFGLERVLLPIAPTMPAVMNKIKTKTSDIATSFKNKISKFPSRDFSGQEKRAAVFQATPCC
jgi:hypothetical protein